MSQQKRRDRGQVEAANPATSPQRLEALSANPALRCIVAGNPIAPANLLERLALDQDHEVREKVASNPNTPWQTLEQLAPEFPQAFLHNPVGSLQVMAHPEQITTDETFWAILLQEASFPSLWWNWLVRHPVLSTSEAICLHVQSAGETTHPFGSPREENEQVLPTLVELLTAAIAQGVSLPVLRLPNQSTIPPEQILREHLQWLAQKGDVQVREMVARNPHTPVEILQTLAQDQDAMVRCEVALHALTPAEMLHLLARDESISVRRSAASHPQTPTEVLHLLARDESALVRGAVASHPQTPTDVLRVLALDNDPGVRGPVARHPQTPTEVFQLLTLDNNRWVRQSLKHMGDTNGLLPVDVLHILARDEKAHVRRFVATNKQTPAEVLRSLALDQARNVRAAIASHEQTPAEVLRSLALDRSRDVRRAVAWNRQTPVEVLRSLALDQSRRVRRSVASHEQTPSETLQALALDRDEGVRRTVAWNRQTPAQALQSLALDQDSEVRLIVTWNQQTPVELLQGLAQDQDGAVQRAATMVQRLLAEMGEASRHRRWWELLKPVLFSAAKGYPGDPDDLIERQIGRITNLVSYCPQDVSKSLGEKLLAVFASGWDVHLIQSAFSRKKGTAYVRHTTAAIMPPIALQKLAASPRWEVRYLVALHPQTPWETRQRLSQDGNRYVRAMARVRMDGASCFGYRERSFFF